MSYSIIDDATYWKIMGNTIIYRELFMSFGGTWNNNGWIFNKNMLTKENFDIMISKTTTVIPLILCENELYYIIKGNTTPYREAIRVAGGKWMNSYWGFKKRNIEERTFTKEYVENLLQNLINKNIPMTNVVKNIPMTNVVKNIPMTNVVKNTSPEMPNILLDNNTSIEMSDSILSKMSDNELRKELTKALAYVKKIKEIMKQKIDDE